MLREKPNNCLGLRFLDHLSRAKVAGEGTQWRERFSWRKRARAGGEERKQFKGIKPEGKGGDGGAGVTQPGRTDTASMLL